MLKLRQGSRKPEEVRQRKWRVLDIRSSPTSRAARPVGMGLNALIKHAGQLLHVCGVMTILLAMDLENLIRTDRVKK